jgi:hypothetical protein
MIIAADPTIDTAASARMRAGVPYGAWFVISAPSSKIIYPPSHRTMRAGHHKRYWLPNYYVHLDPDFVRISGWEALQNFASQLSRAAHVAEQFAITPGPGFLGVSLDNQSGRSASRQSADYE